MALARIEKVLGSPNYYEILRDIEPGVDGHFDEIEDEGKDCGGD